MSKVHTGVGDGLLFDKLVEFGGYGQFAAADVLCHVLSGSGTCFTLYYIATLYILNIITMMLNIHDVMIECIYFLPYRRQHLQLTVSTTCVQHRDEVMPPCHFNAIGISIAER